MIRKGKKPAVYSNYLTISHYLNNECNVMLWWPHIEIHSAVPSTLQFHSPHLGSKGLCLLYYLVNVNLAF